ncbi:hypothetical protein BJX70DRAFT_397915 [Aspergillus crustosus]
MAHSLQSTAKASLPLHRFVLSDARFMLDDGNSNSTRPATLAEPADHLDIPSSKLHLHLQLHPPPSKSSPISDLHLELNQQYNSYTIPVRAKHLILAGDIGRLADSAAYLAFLKSQTDRFELVFLVLGNHEFYNGSHEAGLERARQFVREPALNSRLVVLHRGRYDLVLPGITITVLGFQAMIKDFQNIDSWTIDSHNAAYEADAAWLISEIKSIQKEE